MKKLVALLLVLLVVLTSCSNDKKEEPKKDEPKNQETGSTYKVGTYALTDPYEVKDNGAQFYTTIVTVVVDPQGKVVNANVDVAQNKVELKDGAIVLPAENLSKVERGDAYGMKKVSKIGKEWYEQANAYEAYITGKTVEEIKALEIDDEKHFVADDLKSSVSIKVTSIVEATVKAIEQAVAVEGKIAKVGTANTTELSDKAPAEGKDGEVTANTYISWVALDEKGNVLKAYLDTAQNKMAYAAEELKGGEVVESKQVRGEGYGMKAASKIGKEWNEQATAFADYFIGKPASDIAKTEVAENKAINADILATTTIKVVPYIAILDKAVTNAIELGK